MRNAGDRMPGGSAGRRHRAPSGEQPPPAAGAGGPSLFTPAYRVNRGDRARPDGSDSASHGNATAGSDTPGYGGAGYGRGADLGRSGYGWADQRSGGYQEQAYGSHDASWPGGPTAGYGWPDDDPGSAWPSTGTPRQGTIEPRSNAVRGFPPAPDEPLPVYPPGPFAAWNRRQSDRPGGQHLSGGAGAAGHGAADEGGALRAGGSGSAGQLATATITPDEFDTDYSLPAITDPIPGRAPASPGRAAATTEADRTADRRGAGSRAPVAAQGTRRAPGGADRDQAPGRRTRGKARPRRKRQSAWLAIGTAIVIIAAVGAVLFFTSPGGSSPVAGPTPRQTPTNAASSPSPPAGQWGFIGSRKTDPVPLSLPELYPASFSNRGVVYTKARGVRGTDCHAALIGTDLQAAVRRGGCTQALRATYLSKSAKQMATIGVFNLKTAALASRAALKAGPSEFVAQLAAKAGPARSIGQGTGIEEALYKGHYLVLVWAESTNLTAQIKGKAVRARFEAFMQLLVNRTVNASLSSRMVDGKPANAAQSG